MWASRVRDTLWVIVDNKRRLEPKIIRRSQDTSCITRHGHVALYIYHDSTIARKTFRHLVLCSNESGG
jgi:hypothetical protein